LWAKPAFAGSSRPRRRPSYGKVSGAGFQVSGQAHPAGGLKSPALGEACLRRLIQAAQAAFVTA
ncbi:MAG: hypothetical protein WCG26_06145, partial [Chloroflexales bacterium]